MVTPNLNKNVWYLEKNLVNNRLIKVFCKMNLINMRNILKTCPIPEICFCPMEYQIDDPESFVRTINKIQNKKVFDFIPYVRQFSIRNKTINKESVYYLHGNIKLVNNNCFK